PSNNPTGGPRSGLAAERPGEAGRYEDAIRGYCLRRRRQGFFTVSCAGSAPSGRAQKTWGRNSTSAAVLNRHRGGGSPELTAGHSVSPSSSPLFTPHKIRDVAKKCPKPAFCWQFIHRERAVKPAESNKPAGQVPGMLHHVRKVLLRQDA